MTEKLDPGWLCTRMPTEEDGDELGLVYWLAYGNVVTIKGYKKVMEGELWSVIKKSHILLKSIATPDELLAREQEQSHECGECGQEWEGDGDCPVCLRESSNGEDELMSHIYGEKEQEKIKELEKALDNSEKAYANGYDKARKSIQDLLEDTQKILHETRQALTESEERYSSLEIDTTKLKEYLNKEEKENDILWKLLKIYKFGDD
ncbi:MAG: hypothetical protein IIC69_03385 [Nanoarchaeota archaeon]|nr:hypothetical protein [Nanoarchaeota archaeon]